MSAIPNMRVYLPSDRHQTRELAKALLWDEKPAYIRVGRNPVEDIYTEDSVPFVMDQATVLQEGAEVLLVACGEMVRSAKSAGEQLAQIGHPTTVLDMYCVKPLDKASIVRYAQGAKLVVTVEEHSLFGGLGSMVAQVVGAECPKRVINLALPDTPVITGTSQDVFDYYGLNTEGIVNTVMKGL